ncbi:receptor-like protein EIX2 [Dioscorea cayenensis subsp. rotundata]|uniref:Receptor-like protein EIX2 n=1 Tax=Dioscorea cayennensis subsp. rotundata TaxID=55577 RepID=A0AB40C3M9_DIOCR|nr:receptor-like protein EIX2 [Dioscorea cayenensis subsp. rotundata]
MDYAMYVLLQLVILLSVVLINTSSCSACMESERRALLEFKKHIKDPNNKLSSWVMGQNCCSWEGVHCDNLTGNIVRLELKGPDHQISNEHYLQLRGEISPSLLQLRHLNHVDLSGNFFNGTSIPSFIGQFKQLIYLNLSNSYFHGAIPSSFGNLSSLQTLDLSYNHGIYVDDPAHQWLSHLTSLQHLDMSGVTLLGNMSTSLFLALNKLPSINELHLSRCNLEKLPLSYPHFNFTSLSILDLSYNHINFLGISWVFNINSLQYLDLSFNGFHQLTTYWSSRMLNGYIDTSQQSEINLHESIGSLCSLQTLDLSGLNINKTLVELGGLFSGCLKHSLTHLQLSSTDLNGDIPDWIGDIKNLRLEYINLAYNRLSGIISEEHFTQLEKLETLDMSGSALVFRVSSNWVPPFLLNELRISTSTVGPEFPAWIQTQHKLNTLDLSENEISSTVPHWLWNLTTRNLVHLDLSSNQIQGMIPKLLTFSHIEHLYLSANLFSGPLPDWLCQMKGIVALDISINHLSGELPNCWSDSSALSYINLAYNNLSGALPNSIFNLRNLKSLLLSHNKLSGELPDSMKNSSQLLALDLSHNNFTGDIPTWMGECLSF